MLLFGYVFAAVVVGGLFYGINEVMLEDDDDGVVAVAESGTGDLLDADDAPDDTADDAPGEADQPQADDAPDGQTPDAQDADPANPNAQDADDDPQDSGEGVPNPTGDDDAPDAQMPTRSINFADGAQLIEGFDPDNEDLDLTISPDTRLETGNSPADNSAFLAEDGDNTVEFLGLEELPAGSISALLPGDSQNGLLARALGLEVLDDDDDDLLLDDPMASNYVVGSDGSDVLELTAGMAIASLNDGDDSFISTALAGDSVLSRALNLGMGGMVEDTDTNAVQRVSGGDGNDTIDAGAAGGFLTGDDGDDLILAGSGSAIVEGGAGNDTISHFGHPMEGDFFLDLAGDIAWLTDGARDVLNGGAGNDVIRGDQFDTLTGGAGDDRFEVAHDSRLENDFDTVVITDFEPENDQLQVILDAGRIPDGQDSLDATPTLVEVAGSTEVWYDGTKVALLQGLTGLNAADVAISITAMPEAVPA